MKVKAETYLDGAANTPISKVVLDAMKPFLTDGFVGNSQSVHDYGIEAHVAVEDAREDIAEVIGTSADHIIFTSGATEGNNWVIKMTALKQLLIDHKSTHIICGAFEHDSITNACKQLEEFGCCVDYITPDSKGLRWDVIAPYIRESTCLICTSSVNNELGTYNEAGVISDKAAELGIKTLVDCTQSVGYGGTNICLKTIFPKATYLTFSAHKIYGPTGVGILVCDPEDRPMPLINAGSQEFGRRGGTSNVAGIVGTAAAVKEMYKATDYAQHYVYLYNYLMKRLIFEFPKIKLTIVPDQKNIISLDCSNMCDYDKLASVLGTQEIAVAGGSACTEEVDETKGGFNGSHVLVGMGRTEKQIRNTIRVSFTKYTTVKDIDKLLETLKEVENK